MWWSERNNAGVGLVGNQDQRALIRAAKRGSADETMGIDAALSSLHQERGMAGRRQ